MTATATKSEPRYNLSELPEGIVARTEENKSDTSVIKWSGDFPIPQIGDRVKINFNELGEGTVLSYLVEGGYCGVTVRLDKEPAWKVKQHKGTKFAGIAHVFGVEIRERR